MAHDFKNFPELTNNQMQFYYFESPHKQITEDFTAKVVRVKDGDTIQVKWEERDFDFPIRLFDLAAPELDEEGGIEAQAWLEKQILNEYVNIEIEPGLRVEKWGRLLGKIIHMGINMGDSMIDRGLAIKWGDFNNDTLFR